MTDINWRQVVVGGLVAGLVANACDFAITTYFMAAEFSSMLARLNVDGTVSQAWIPVFAAADFVWGLLLVFTYAAIRPRFGPGARTAIIGGVMLWLVIAIFEVLLLAMGLHTLQSYLKGCALYLIAALVSSISGARFYNETIHARASAA
jgi:hypothetical protein